MKLLVTTAILLASAIAAYAGSPTDIPTKQVPEISALAGFAALGVVGAVAALIWERRR